VKAEDGVADVLIVDDDPDLGDTLADVVRLRGHQARVGYDGLEALRLISERRPDVVLFDVEMPVLSGPEAAYVLVLRNCGDERIPVVLLSGVIDLPAVAAGVGTPYYLPKPYNLDAVLHLLHRVLVERIAPRPRRRR
jgi:DNA-binding response OmpR family regulator